MLPDLNNVAIEHLITHRVGNRLRDEGLRLSDTEASLGEDTASYALKYFFSSLNFNEYFTFSHAVSLEMNEVYRLASKIFEQAKGFITHSQNVATLLYQYSMHPKIKAGDLSLIYLTNVSFEGANTTALGIYKSETNSPYLKMTPSNESYAINHDFGYNINSVDKGCLIINADSGNGYRVILASSADRKEESQYWKDEFLKLKPVSDSYHFTSNFLSVAKNFITTGLPQSFEVSKTDQIDYLNKSVEYFKEKDTFDIQGFQQEVFGDPEIIKSFQDFGSNYLHENKIDIADTFEISNTAVKKQSRIFKNVLKLDRNFHIYIHGNTDLIEKGYDELTGKHYYKIYYDNES